MDWNALIREISHALPELSLWMHSVPVIDGDGQTEESVGFAVQRESEPRGRWYLVVFFRLVPDPDAIGSDGGFLPGRGEDVSD